MSIGCTTINVEQTWCTIWRKKKILGTVWSVDLQTQIAAIDVATHTEYSIELDFFSPNIFSLFFFFVCCRFALMWMWTNIIIEWRMLDISKEFLCEMCRRNWIWILFFVYFFFFFIDLYLLPIWWDKLHKNIVIIYQSLKWNGFFSFQIYQRIEVYTVQSFGNGRFFPTKKKMIHRCRYTFTWTVTSQIPRISSSNT